MIARRLGLAIAAVGLALLIAAAVVKWAVAPQVAALPTDLDWTINLEGSRIDHVIDGGEVRVDDLSIVVHDRWQATGSDGALTIDRVTATRSREIAEEVRRRYALDPVDRSNVAGSSDDIPRRSGWSLALPPDPPIDGLTWWIDAAGTAVPLEAGRTETVARKTVRTYTLSAADLPLVEGAARARLPVTISALTAAELGDVDAGELDDTVRLAYTVDVDATIVVEVTTGVVLRSEWHEVVVASASEGGPVLGPVRETTLGTSDATFRAFVDLVTPWARDIRRARTLFPNGLGATGVALLLIGVPLAVVRPRSDTDA